MPLLHLAIALLSAISPVAAAQVSIFQVSSVVSSATSYFAPAVIYASPTGSATSALATAAPSPYWLESITHQGISAFNSDPASYQVFRNVKSFGAKGKISVLGKAIQF
jgi:glucan 1,3-beta-glucosidase